MCYHLLLFSVSLWHSDRAEPKQGSCVTVTSHAAQHIQTQEVELTALSWSTLPLWQASQLPSGMEVQSNFNERIWKCLTEVQPMVCIFVCMAP